MAHFPIRNVNLIAVSGNATKRHDAIIVVVETNDHRHTAVNRLPSVYEHETFLCHACAASQLLRSHGTGQIRHAMISETESDRSRRSWLIVK